MKRQLKTLEDLVPKAEAYEAKLASSQQALTQFSSKLVNLVQDIATGQYNTLALLITLAQLQHEHEQLLNQFKVLNEIACHYQAQSLTTEQQLNTHFSQTTTSLNTLAIYGKQLTDCSMALSATQSNSKQSLWHHSGHEDNPELMQLLSALPQKCNEPYTQSYALKKLFEHSPEILQPSLVTDPAYDLPEYLLKTPASFTYEAWLTYSHFEIHSEIDQKLANAIHNYCALKIEPAYQTLLQLNIVNSVKPDVLQDPRNIYADQYPELNNALTQAIKRTQQWLRLNPKHKTISQIYALHMRLLTDEINITYNYYQLFYRQTEPNNWNERLVLLGNLEKELLKFQENLARQKFNLRTKQFDAVANLIYQYLHLLHTEIQHTITKSDRIAKSTSAKEIKSRVSEPPAAMALSSKLDKSYATDILNSWVIPGLRSQQLMSLPEAEQIKLQQYQKRLSAFTIELVDNFEMLQQASHATLQLQLCLTRIQTLRELQYSIEQFLADLANNKTLLDGKTVFSLLELRIPKAFLDYIPGNPLLTKYGSTFNLKEAITKEIRLIERLQQRLNKHIAHATKQTQERHNFIENFNYILANEALQNPSIMIVQRLVTALATCGLRSGRVNTPLYEYLNETPITIGFAQQLDKKTNKPEGIIAFLNYLTQGLEHAATDKSIRILLEFIKPLSLQSKPASSPIIGKLTKQTRLWMQIKALFNRLLPNNSSVSQPTIQAMAENQPVVPQTIGFNFPYNQSGQQARLILTITSGHTLQLVFNFPSTIQSYLSVTGKKEIFIDSQEIFHLQQQEKGYTFHNGLILEAPQNARIHDKMATNHHLLVAKPTSARSKQAAEAEKVLQTSIEPAGLIKSNKTYTH